MFWKTYLLFIFLSHAIIVYAKKEKVVENNAHTKHHSDRHHAHLATADNNTHDVSNDTKAKKRSTSNNKVNDSIAPISLEEDKELLTIRQHLQTDRHSQIPLHSHIHDRTQCLNVVQSPLASSSWKLKYFNPSINPIFMCDFPLTEESLGNRLGEYLEAIACCDIVGMHFINTYNLPHSHTSSGSSSSSSGGTVAHHGKTFFHYLPTVVRHPHPSINIKPQDRYQAIQSHCPALTSYPHEQKGAWSERIDLVSSILTKALEASYPNPWYQRLDRKTFDNITYGTKYSPPTTTTTNEDQDLPLVPDAAILFRCKDILVTHPSHPYGFLRFDLYSKLIPRNITTIYVLSEPLSYRNNAKHGNDRYSIDMCQRLSIDLVAYLATTFPKAMIALRRGYPFDAFAMLSFSKRVICPPSTFCLWPGFVQEPTQKENGEGERDINSISDDANATIRSSTRKTTTTTTTVKTTSRKVFMSPNDLFHDQPFISSSFHWLMKPKVLHLLTPEDVDSMNNNSNNKAIYEKILAQLMKPVARSNIEFANAFVQETKSTE